MLDGLQTSQIGRLIKAVALGLESPEQEVSQGFGHSRHRWLQLLVLGVEDERDQTPILCNRR